MATDFVWGAPQAARLRIAAREARLTQQDLVERTGIPIATLQRILNGAAVPRMDRLKDLVAAVGNGLTVDYVLNGDEDRSAGVVEVPVFDVQVAAGYGRVPLDDAQASGTWPFQADWLAASFGSSADLKLVRVSGDSQEPELRDGDLVMIDTRDPTIREGMQVVRLDESLFIKRLQLRGTDIALRSANPLYEDIIVSRDQINSGEFSVIGRAVWASKLL